MLTFEVKPESLRNVTDYIEQAKLRVLTGIRLGMRDAMEGLALHAAENAPKLSGELSSRLMRSAEVVETPVQIVGDVRPRGFSQILSRWQERGVNEPAVNIAALRDASLTRLAKRMAGTKVRGSHYVNRRVMIYDPKHAGDPSGYFTSHRAFQVTGRAFMQRSLDEYQAQIVEMINQRVAQAMSA